MKLKIPSNGALIGFMVGLNIGLVTGGAWIWHLWKRTLEEYFK